MMLHELITKLLDGVVDAGVRADAITAFSYMVEAYRLGRVDDNTLRQDLKEFCLDVLAVKYPTRDVEELAREADEWVEKLYRIIRMIAIRDRALARSGLRG